MSWIKKISDSIAKGLSFVRKPAETIPPILLVCEVMKRPGLSAMAIVASILTQLEEAGIPTGKNPDGSPNKIGIAVNIGVNALVNAFKDDAVVDSVIQTNSIMSVGLGENAGGPMQLMVQNINNIPSRGIIR